MREALITPATKQSKWLTSLKKSGRLGQSAGRMGLTPQTLLAKFEATRGLSASAIRDESSVRPTSVDTLRKAEKLTNKKAERAASLHAKLGRLQSRVHTVEVAKASTAVSLCTTLQQLERLIRKNDKKAKTTAAHVDRLKAVAKDYGDRIRCDASKLEQLLESQLKVEAQVARLVSQSGLVTPVDKSLPVAALVAAQEASLVHNQGALTSLRDERRILERQIRDLGIIEEEVSRYDQA